MSDSAASLEQPTAAPLVESPPAERITDTSPAPGSGNEIREKPELPHDSRMREIYARREEQRAKELMYGDLLEHEANDRERGVEIGTTEREHAEQRALRDAQERSRSAQAAREVQQRQPQAAAPQPAPIAQTQTGDLPRRAVNVGGQVVHLTDAEIHSLAELGAETIRQRQMGGGQPQQQPVQQQMPVAPPPQQQLSAQQIAAANPGIDDATARDIARALTYGNDEDSVAAIRRLYATAARNQIDPNQLVAVARDQAISAMRAEQQQRQLNSDLTTISNEFPDVFQSNRFSQLAALAVHDIRARDQLTGRVTNNLNVYREACNEVRQIMSGGQRQPLPAQSQQNQTANGYAQNAQTPQSQNSATYAQRTAVDGNSMSSRLNRKRAAPATIVGISRAAPMRGDDNAARPKTQSEIVAQMRAARGQISMN